MITLKAPNEPDSLFKMSSVLQEMVNVSPPVPHHRFHNEQLTKLALTKPEKSHFSFIQLKVLPVSPFADGEAASFLPSDFHFGLGDAGGGSKPTTTHRQQR